MMMHDKQNNSRGLFVAAVSAGAVGVGLGALAAARAYYAVKLHAWDAAVRADIDQWQQNGDASAHIARLEARLWDIRSGVGRLVWLPPPLVEPPWRALLVPFAPPQQQQGAADSAPLFTFDAPPRGGPVAPPPGGPAVPAAPAAPQPTDAASAAAAAAERRLAEARAADGSGAV